MSNNEGFLISVIVIMGIILFMVFGEVRHNPCDFPDVSIYQEWDSEEFIKCE